MIKLMGSILILSGGVLVRYFQAMDRRRRMDTLSDFLSALRRMGEEIRMTRMPLPVLLDRLAAGCGEDAGGFFQRVSSAARQGEELAGVWRQAAKELPLPAADREALADLGDSLHGDEENICKVISLAAYEIAKSLEEAAHRKPEEDKRSTALCLSSAALLVILLI